MEKIWNETSIGIRRDRGNQITFKLGDIIVKPLEHTSGLVHTLKFRYKQKLLTHSDKLVKSGNTL